MEETLKDSFKVEITRLDKRYDRSHSMEKIKMVGFIMVGFVIAMVPELVPLLKALK